MRKSILEKRLARLEAKKAGIVTRCNASEDATEVRSLTAELEEVNAEIAETKEEIEAIETEERSATPAQGKAVNAGIVGSFATTPKAEERSEDKHATMEYRQAFMQYFTTGKMESRNGDVISTNETSVLIPTTVMNEVINLVNKSYGSLYAKVRKVQVPGGVEIPVGSLQASFKWITESTVSPRQKVDALGKISFAYHQAEIRVAQTFLSKLVTLDAFEREISSVIAQAYLEAMDYGIVRGSGDGCMTGIINDARVTNTVTMSATDMADWKKWKTKLFATLPIKGKSGEFIMADSTVVSYLETMADNNNRPLFAEATGGTEDRFFGRVMTRVEPEIIPDFDTASAGAVIGIYWQPNQYLINENFAFTMMRYFDQETNEWVDKAITVVDGKVLNPTSFVKIVKG